jgi:sRNA-binding carbon storage regulator CsrA
MHVAFCCVLRRKVFSGRRDQHPSKDRKIVMLTFTRKNGQSVVVQVAGHPPLTITFLGSRPGKCQLAFDGPQEYHILREELTLREPLVSNSPFTPSSSATSYPDSPRRVAAVCGT